MKCILLVDFDFLEMVTKNKKETDFKNQMGLKGNNELSSVKLPNSLLTASLLLISK